MFLCVNFTCYLQNDFSHDDCSTFGQEAISNRDPVGRLGGSRGTTRLSSIISLQFTGQC